jgi:hypothetical protein
MAIQKKSLIGNVISTKKAAPTPKAAPDAPTTIAKATASRAVLSRTIASRTVLSKTVASRIVF